MFVRVHRGRDLGKERSKDASFSRLSFGTPLGGRPLLRDWLLFVARAGAGIESAMRDTEGERKEKERQTGGGTRAGRKAELKKQRSVWEHCERDVK